MMVRVSLFWLPALSVAITVTVLAPATRDRAVEKEPSAMTVTFWPLTVTVWIPAAALALPVMLRVAVLVYEPSDRAEIVRVGALARSVTLKALEVLPPAVVTVTVPAPATAVVATVTGRLIDVDRKVAGARDTQASIY